MTEGVSKFTWGKKRSETERRSPPVTSIVEIMSETLAEDLQEKDLLEFDQEQEALEAGLREMDMEGEQEIVNDCSRDYELALQLQDDPDYSVDAQLALELQRQFDREADFQRQLEKAPATEKTKGGTKIILPFDSFAYSKLENELQHKDDEVVQDEEREKANDEHYRSKVQEFPPCGFRRNQNGDIITRHDKEVGLKKNCQKMMTGFPSNFKSGDLLESRLSSRIYNDLQMFSKTESKRGARLKDKTGIATSDASVDVKSRLILLKWIDAGSIDRVEGVIAIGKESTVLTGVRDAVQVGTSSDEGPSEERHFAIKVHKQVLNAFRNRGEYLNIKDDYHFKNPRSILKIWTEREYMNLQRLHRAGLPCPTPIQYKRNVLLMSMIEDETGPAPKLKNYIWTSEEEKTGAFNQVKEIINKMFNECKLVHADLSEFNLLFSGDKIYVIDVAQAVELSHPQALVYLHRDMENVLNFFDRNATEGLPTCHELFAEVTDLQVDAEKDLLAQIESFNEQNLFTNLARFRSNPGEYELIMQGEDELDDSSESEEE